MELQCPLCHTGTRFQGTEATTVFRRRFTWLYWICEAGCGFTFTARREERARTAATMPPP